MTVIRPHSFQSVAPLSSSDGTAGPSVVERSEGPALPTVRHISRDWTGTLLGYGKHEGEYRVRWHDRDDVYQVAADQIELVPLQEETIELRILLLCSATLETLGKLSKELTELKRETDEAIAKLRGMS